MGSGFRYVWIASDLKAVEDDETGILDRDIRIVCDVRVRFLKGRAVERGRAEDEIATGCIPASVEIGKVKPLRIGAGGDIDANSGMRGAIAESSNGLRDRLPGCGARSCIRVAAVWRNIIIYAAGVGRSHVGERISRAVDGPIVLRLACGSHLLRFERQDRA